jgi:hypothetical protein
MSESRGDDAMRMDPALAVTSRSVDAGVPSPSTESGVAESGTPETRRVRAVSAFLLDHPPLLLPLASHFREPQLIFESAIRGPSMAPAIPSHARLRVQLLGPQPCQPGDVVFYLADDGYIVHRVVYRARRGSAPDYLLTCGDNRLAPDPPVQGNQVLGTVIAVQNARYWQPPSPPTTAPFYKRMIRAITLTAMITALWFSAVAARRLAAILLDLELVGRASVRRLRCRLHLDRFER